MAGTRIAKVCDTDAMYFSAIDACVPLSIASTPEFLNSFSLTNPCTGGEIATQAQMEGLRYCNTVYGGLNITINVPDADFTALFDISAVIGLCTESNLTIFDADHDFINAGPLVINNSSMTTMSVFANLLSVTPTGGLVNVDGHPYSVVVTGSVFCAVYDVYGVYGVCVVCMVCVCCVCVSDYVLVLHMRMITVYMFSMLCSILLDRIHAQS